MKKLICLIVLLAATVSAKATSFPYPEYYIYTAFNTNHSGLGALASPGQLTDTFSTKSGPGWLNFQLQGYGTLDGDGNGYTDVFSLQVNGVTVLSGSWDLGGGGNNVFYFNPYNATVNAVSNGRGAGGTADFSLPIQFVYGTNSITFSYAGNAQGLGDEGWGINEVQVAVIPEPETYAMLLAGLGLLGFMTRRKSGRQVA
ncbi:MULTISPECIES: FxDxF family PEP-CTERM protein [unclassified Janthinobacterium]|uniref:FxDxF family PEP-CTERM protein n=1 Tax=unclassified Janthinobacterium TaxID=2610881 RepID=UPI00160CFB84|nr:MULTISPECIES: FxDxF family PEP-CTERM protein [unclassified Janthinobacterium]MBB5371553.1 hypothetical protein [Janthinobacterium sp. K2C7]MBB5384379.1 hypothetical protein [Janthinobacterium sp. K2Li3]MBB5389655.1 hypothetical protein [Janthinobacterium sp. K2E3]